MTKRIGVSILAAMPNRNAIMKKLSNGKFKITGSSVKNQHLNKPKKRTVTTGKLDMPQKKIELNVRQALESQTLKSNVENIKINNGDKNTIATIFHNEVLKDPKDLEFPP